MFQHDLVRVEFDRHKNCRILGQSLYHRPARLLWRETDVGMHSQIRTIVST